MEVALRVLIWLYLCVCSLRPLEAFSDLPDGCVPLGSAHGQRGSVRLYARALPAVVFEAIPASFALSTPTAATPWCDFPRRPACAQAADYKPGVSLPAGPYLLSASSQGGGPHL